MLPVPELPERNEGSQATKGLPLPSLPLPNNTPKNDGRSPTDRGMPDDLSDLLAPDEFYLSTVEFSSIEDNNEGGFADEVEEPNTEDGGSFEEGVAAIEKPSALPAYNTATSSIPAEELVDTQVTEAYFDPFDDGMTTITPDTEVHESNETSGPCQQVTEETESVTEKDRSGGPDEPNRAHPEDQQDLVVDFQDDIEALLQQADQIVSAPLQQSQSIETPVDTKNAPESLTEASRAAEGAPKDSSWEEEELPDYVSASEFVPVDEEKERLEEISRQNIVPADLPEREDPPTGSFFPRSTEEDITYREPVEEDEPEPSFPARSVGTVPGITEEYLSSLHESEAEMIDNPLLIHDEEEDFDEPLSVRRKRFMRQVRVESENTGFVPEASPELVEKIRPRKKVGKGAYVGAGVAASLLVASGAVAFYMVQGQNAIAEKQAAVDAAYAADGTDVTGLIKCDTGWQVQEDTSSYTKNINCLPEEDKPGVQVLYSRGIIDGSRVWPRAANLLPKNAYVVTDNEHWGAIATEPGSLEALASAKGKPICNLIAKGGLECPKPAAS